MSSKGSANSQQLCRNAYQVFVFQQEFWFISMKQLFQVCEVVQSVGVKSFYHYLLFSNLSKLKKLFKSVLSIQGMIKKDKFLISYITHKESNSRHLDSKWTLVLKNILKRFIKRHPQMTSSKDMLIRSYKKMPSKKS